MHEHCTGTSESTESVLHARATQLCSSSLYVSCTSSFVSLDADAYVALPSPLQELSQLQITFHDPSSIGASFFNTISPPASSIYPSLISVFPVIISLYSTGKLNVVYFLLRLIHIPLPKCKTSICSLLDSHPSWRPTFPQHFTCITMYSKLCNRTAEPGRKSSSSTVKQMSLLTSPSSQLCALLQML